MKRLVLIDGNAILHRAYHALPPLTSKNGELTNAVYGFFSMLLKIASELRPDYLAVCFDRAAPTFRQQLYVGYQAHRPKMDNELVPQISLVHEVLEKAKISIFEIDGYEADDLIGTLSVQAREKKIEDRRWKMGVEDGSLKVEREKIYPQSSSFKNPPSTVYHPSSNLEVIIVSGDRDMLQLVNSHVKVLAPIIGITKMILFDAQKVEEKYGLKPAQIIDYKALVGDPSDNYPGVSGVGPKTASGLLKQYETLENLYQSIGKLPPKISEKLATDAEQVSLAKKLATIVTDAPITLDLEKCSSKQFDIKGLEEKFEELGFKSLIKRLRDEGSKGTPLRQGSEGQAEETKQLGFL